MSNLPIYEMLAQAFASEGVDTVFNLMGDGNMHWATAMSKIDGVQSFHARHEHCASAWRVGYYSATGKTGVASVTCGPGVTQITTILSTAMRARVPLVVFAGESPMNAKWYNQAIDQAPLVTATGAHYVRAHSAKLMHEYVREAFYTARYERRPTVLGVPYDLQKVAWSGGPDYRPSADYIPQPGRTLPSPESVARLADKIASAKRPIIIGGRGAVASGAQAAIEELAEAAGALLATSLPGARHVRREPLFRGRRRRLRQRRRPRAVRGGGPGDRDRREPHILHCRRRRPVPEGLCRADRRAAARPARRRPGRRPVPEGRCEGRRRGGDGGAQAARRQERRLSLGRDCGKDQEHADRSGRVPDRARHLRSTRRDRRSSTA